MSIQGAIASTTKNPLTNADFPGLPRSSLFVSFSENSYIKRRIKSTNHQLALVR